MDQYVRGSFQDVQLNRALQHWLSCANLPHNVVDGGAFINWCYNMNPRYRVPSRPYIQRNFLQPVYTAATKMLSVYLMYSLLLSHFCKLVKLAWFVKLFSYETKLK